MDAIAAASRVSTKTTANASIAAPTTTGHQNTRQSLGMSLFSAPSATLADPSSSSSSSTAARTETSTRNSWQPPSSSSTSMRALSTLASTTGAGLTTTRVSSTAFSSLSQGGRVFTMAKSSRTAKDTGKQPARNEPSSFERSEDSTQEGEGPARKLVKLSHSKAPFSSAQTRTDSTERVDSSVSNDNEKYQSQSERATRAEPAQDAVLDSTTRQPIPTTPKKTDRSPSFMTPSPDKRDYGQDLDSMLSSSSAFVSNPSPSNLPSFFAASGSQGNSFDPIQQLQHHADLNSSRTRPSRAQTSTNIHTGSSSSSNNNNNSNLAGKPSRIPFESTASKIMRPLRSDRPTSLFKARPVDPKVFASAGDLGVPRIRKPPLTIPVSPNFSKPRIKSRNQGAMSGLSNKSAAATRLANMLRAKPTTKGEATASDSTPSSSTIGTKPAMATPLLTDSQRNKFFGIPLTTAPATQTAQEDTRDRPSSVEEPTGRKSSIIYPSTTATTTNPNPLIDAIDSSRRNSNIVYGLPIGTHGRKSILGPPMRIDPEGPTGVDAGKSRETGSFLPISSAKAPSLHVDHEDGSQNPGQQHQQNQQNQPIGGHNNVGERTLSWPRKQLTRPIPFKFATDELLRKRTFHPNTAILTNAPVKEGGIKGPGGSSSRAGTASSIFKRTPQPFKKTLTVPAPFQLETQLRAETRGPVHHQYHPHPSSQGSSTAATAESSTSTLSLSSRNPRRLSRLAGLKPLLPSTTMATTTTTTTTTKTVFKPTVPVSPKFGRRVTPVRALGPPRFLLQKSTKELTQPQGFQFRSEQRARVRETFEESVRRRERELAGLRQKNAQLYKDQESKTRAAVKSTSLFRAQPIKHYQPTIIHHSGRPLTKPTSPMIGDKRKRYEMERQYLEQQEQGPWAQPLEQDQVYAMDKEYEQQQQQQQQQYKRRSNLHMDEVQQQQQQQQEEEEVVYNDQVSRDEMYQVYEEATLMHDQEVAIQEQLEEQERRHSLLSSTQLQRPSAIGPGASIFGVSSHRI